MRTLGPALRRRRRPPRVRRLRKMRRDHRRRMAPVCLLSVFATRRHGRKPPILFVVQQGPRRPGCSRPALNKTCRLRHGPRVHTHRRNTCPKTDVAASSVVDAARRRVMVSLQCPSASPYPRPADFSVAKRFRQAKLLALAIVPPRCDVSHSHTALNCLLCCCLLRAFLLVLLVHCILPASFCTLQYATQNLQTQSNAVLHCHHTAKKTSMRLPRNSTDIIPMPVT